VNAGSLRIIAVSPEDRRGLFLATANQLGTLIQNVEKDFWVSGFSVLSSARVQHNWHGHSAAPAARLCFYFQAVIQ
jgi:hypothetical protein